MKNVLAVLIAFTIITLPSCTNSKPLVKKPLVIAHRGASGYAPENTLASIKKALEFKPDYIEIDVHYSKEKEVMVLHDHTLERTSNGKGDVTDYTKAELQAFDAGAWFGEEFKGEKIPTLAEIVEAINGQSILLIEVKKGKDYYIGIEQKIDSIIKAHNATAWCEVQSFYDHYVEGFIAIQPDYKIHKLIVGDISWLPLYIDHKPRFGNPYGWGNKVAGINPSRKFASQGFINKLHEKGYTCFSYTVNEPEDIKKLIERGIDGIITNYPDRVAKVFE